MVPKILRPLVKFWVPDAFVISFKLETDADILLEKAREALNRYGHKLVIANELNTRKWKVILVTADESELIEIDPNSNQFEIEQLIVTNVIQRHEKFIENLREQNSSK
ncbi:phosphopantothenate-cysteine ligase-like protein [Euroglyphus maynei]|uniref:Phosphopantothenate-cysteine ligase-like protein n=1 Tax=Euroglyphus maynei TaxID=6958 RepID=A0A1Y3AWB1_EURMA|nr:phosphopantothenate-cysteine ligase-like protein [Euroglyphus maynei]